MFLLYVLLVYACTILYSTVKLKHDRFYCRQILIHRKQKLEKKIKSPTILFSTKTYLIQLIISACNLTSGFSMSHLL